MVSFQILINRVYRMIKQYNLQVIILSLLLGFGGGIWFGLQNINDIRLSNIHDTMETLKLDDGYLAFGEEGVREQIILDILAENTIDLEISEAYGRIELRVNYIFQDGQQNQLIPGLIYGIPDMQDLEVNQLEISQEVPEPNFSTGIYFTKQSYHLLQERGNLELNSSIKVNTGVGTYITKIQGSVYSPEWISIIDPESNLMSLGSNFLIGYLSLESLQNWLGKLDWINQYVVDFREMDNSNKEDQDLIEIKGNMIANQINSNQITAKFVARHNTIVYSFLMDDIENDQKIFRLLGVFIYIIALFGMIITLNRLLKHQRRQIGIDLSIGATDVDIVSIYFVYVFVIGIFSCIFSLGSGILFRNFLNAIFRDSYTTISWNLNINWKLLLQTWLISLACCVFAMWITVKKILKLKPIDALRTRIATFHKSKTRFKHQTKKRDSTEERLNREKDHFFSRIKEKIYSIIPLNSKMSARNIFRKKGRTFATLLGFMIAMALVIGIFNVRSSIDLLIENQDKEAGTWDMKVELNTPISSFQIKSLINLTTGENEVISQSFALILPASIVNNPNQASISESYETLMLSGYNSTKNLPLSLNWDSYSSRNSGIIISKFFQEEYRWSVGEELELEFITMTHSGFQLKTLGVNIAGFHDRINILETIMKIDQLWEITNISDHFNIGYFKTAPTIDESKLTYDLTIQASVRQVIWKATYNENFQELIDEMRQILTFLMGLAYSLGFGIFLIMADIIRLERKREIGTMLTIGTSDTMIIKFMMQEISIIASISILLGILVGSLFTEYLAIPILEDTLQVFRFKSIMLWSRWILLGVAGMVLANLSQVLTLRMIKRIKLGEATKVRDF